MKLISLNTWGGRADPAKVLEFFRDNKDTDIFCLQEVWNGGHHMIGKVAGGSLLKGVVPELYREVSRVLKDHDGYFRPHFYDFYGLAMFVKKNIKVTEEGDFFVYKDAGYISKEDVGDHARNIQYMTLKTSSGMRTVMNFHGLWQKNRQKLDNEDRLMQSDRIVAFLAKLQTPFVLCGDFNLMPDTESMRKLEHFGLRNLIKEFGIASTRTSFYLKEERFADYALVSDDIKVNDFKILPDEISDHAAMYLDFK